MEIELLKRIRLSEKGKLVYDSGIVASHSFCKGFLDVLSGILSDRNNPLASIRDRFGDYFSIDSKSAWETDGTPIDSHGGSGNDDEGIIVGSGDMPEANDNYRIQTRIDHGTGAGQLSYAVQTYPVDPSVSGAYVIWGIQRQFTNGSGAGVDVKEIGIYAQYDLSDDRHALLLRDVLDPYLTVPNGQILTIDYYLRTQA